MLKVRFAAIRQSQQQFQMFQRFPVFSWVKNVQGVQSLRSLTTVARSRRSTAALRSKPFKLFEYPSGFDVRLIAILRDPVGH